MALLEDLGIDKNSPITEEANAGCSVYVPLAHIPARSMAWPRIEHRVGLDSEFLKSAKESLA